jgi:hypothetical protein
MVFRVALRADGEVLEADEFDVTIVGAAMTVDCADAEAKIINGSPYETLAF